jgi:16S rRNA (guanine527-N7)-methyltransferase
VKPAEDQTLPAAPGPAREVFGVQLPVAEQFAHLLAEDATVRGLIGPREVPRLWERHLLNCAVVADLIDPGAAVCDIGSGAGLPGLVLAIRRPDLEVSLVEPLLRRTTFLDESVVALGLGNVRVIRGRAEELRGSQEWDVVTSRAVAPMERLIGWSLPLVRSGGAVLAMKGSTVEAELGAAARAIRSAGGVLDGIIDLGRDLVDPPVRVVRVVKG